MIVIITYQLFFVLLKNYTPIFYYFSELLCICQKKKILTHSANSAANIAK